jgi:PleD family two-component response regulator
MLFARRWINRWLGTLRAVATRHALTRVVARKASTEGPLAGRKILLIGDEPVIVLDVAQAFEEAGAHVVTARSPDAALVLLDANDWSVVVLDPELIDDHSSPLIEQLRKRDIPFVLYALAVPTQGLFTMACGSPCRQAPLCSSERWKS